MEACQLDMLSDRTARRQIRTVVESEEEDEGVTAKGTDCATLLGDLSRTAKAALHSPTDWMALGMCNRARTRADCRVRACLYI